MRDDLAAMDAAPAEPPKKRRLIVQAPGTAPIEGNELADAWGKKAPEDSPDLQRILQIPRRKVTEADKLAMVALMNERLFKPRGDPCSCEAEFRRKCVLSLKPPQAWALYEAGITAGILGPIGVGQGKSALDFLTPMVVPDCRTAVLLVPPILVSQLVNEYKLWREHWRVPSLIIRDRAYIVPGAPAVHVIPYSRMSRAEATILLESLNPDLLILDEAHHARHRDTARTSRILRYLATHHNCRVCAWSGSLVDRSIKDYAHLSAYALAEWSPLPLKMDTVAAWAATVDPPPPGQPPAPVGALAALCEPGEHVRSGFRRRLLETRGVVATETPGIGASLYIHARDPGPIPQVIKDALVRVRDAWERPDGEEFVEAFAQARCARELASGFYYKWTFPRGEDPKLIDEWFEARRAWHKEVRNKLFRREPHLDQPFLLAKAAIRAWDEIYDGPLPKWRAETWPRWKAIRGQVEPVQAVVWLDDYLVRDAAAWALDKHEHGIVWYEHSAFGQALAAMTQLPIYFGGDAVHRIQDADGRLKEDGSRSVIVSTNSYGAGLNGAQFVWHRQLVANPPVSKQTGGAARWEQLLGRLHREGQEAPEIHTWVYRHTPEMRDGWDRARELARYVTDTLGSFQKLLSTSETW